MGILSSLPASLARVIAHVVKDKEDTFEILTRLCLSDRAWVVIDVLREAASNFSPLRADLVPEKCFTAKLENGEILVVIEGVTPSDERERVCVALMEAEEGEPLIRPCTDREMGEVLGFGSGEGAQEREPFEEAG